MKIKELIKEASWSPGSLITKNTPKVTVLMPTYSRGNDGSFLRSAESLLNQTFVDIELIIIDDASTDGTYEQIMRLMEIDGRVSCIRHKYNIGLPAISIYEGFIKSKGEYFFFGFDDNIYELDGIEKLYKFAIKSKNLIVRGKCQYLFEQKFHTLPNLPISTLWTSNFIANSSVLIHRSVLEDVGLYDPHLLLIRVCDFDLWKRIIRKYEFSFLPELITTEYGMVKNDSLGNTRFNDIWANNEFMAINRNNELNPKNFLEYDIDYITPQISNRTQSIIHSLNADYDNKHLEDHKEIIDRPNRTFQTIIRERDKNIILLVDDDISTSELFYFDDLPEKIKSKILFVNTKIWGSSLYLLGNCSCLIVTKGIESANAKNWIACAKSLSIPVYFFLEDSFLTLNKKSKDLLIHELNKASGILVSSKNLKDKIINSKINNHIYCFPISMASKLYDREDFSENPVIRIAVMDINFDRKIFSNIVVPALINIGKEFPIELFLPDSFIRRTSNYEDYVQLKVNFFQIDISYYPEINFLKRLKIDILICPSKEKSSNTCELENEILNACMIGAALIISDDFPNICTYEKIITQVKNSENDWYLGLKSLVMFNENRKRIYKDALQYCRETYNGKQNVQVLSDILNSSPSITSLLELTRYNNIINWCANGNTESQIIANYGFGGIIRILNFKIFNTPLREIAIIAIKKFLRLFNKTENK